MHALQKGYFVLFLKEGIHGEVFFPLLAPVMQFTFQEAIFLEFFFVSSKEIDMHVHYFLHKRHCIISIYNILYPFFLTIYEILPYQNVKFCHWFNARINHCLF